MSMLESLDAGKYFEILADRERRFAEASADPLPESYPVNALAEALHPTRQYLVITRVAELGRDCRCYELAPDRKRGTGSLACFAAGSYLSFSLRIDGRDTTRAYSIASSPREALGGRYRIIVRYIPGGLASGYIFDNWTVGTEVTASAPEGHFGYNRLRDAKTVIASAGGSGIAPFLSLAGAIADGDEDFRMTLLYGSRTKDDILCKEELKGLEASCDKIKVVHVLSEERADGYEHGPITADLIRKYAPDGETYSVFVCGPPAMYDFLEKELPKLGLPRKYIRYELRGEIHDALSMADWPDGAPENVTVRVTIRDETRTVAGSSRDTILQILEQNSIGVPSHCRSGACGWCHSRLLSGRVFIPEKLDTRREADKKYGYIHPCCTFALGDVEIEVPFRGR